MAVVTIRKRHIWRCLSSPGKDRCYWFSPPTDIERAFVFGRWHNDMEKKNGQHQGNIFVVLSFDLDPVARDLEITSLAREVETFTNVSLLR